jgi:shikimate dehydrogenase
MPLTPLGHIDTYTQLVGLIGWPAGPWPSPMIYNAAFDALELNWRYVPLPVPQGRLREALLGLRALGFAGAEVREPHQCDVLSHLDELSSAAEAIGVVNFIRVDERGWLIGDNTRWRSFLGELRATFPSLNGLRPLVMGAGRAARGIVYALTREGLPVTIVNQDIEQAIELVHSLRHVVDEHSFSLYRWPHDLAQVTADANLIINANPIGLWPAVGSSPDEPPAPRAGPYGSPWPDELPIPSDAVVFDMVYRPSESRFLSQARASGAKTVSWLQLLVYEAALAFEKWTGRTPPLEVMFQAAGQALTEEASRDRDMSVQERVPATLT